MRRGELYLVKKPGSQDPKRQRVFVVVSREALANTRFSSVICAPVYSRHDGLTTQVQIGIEEGLKRESSIHCDELVSLPKALLTRYVGRLGESKIDHLNRALLIALDLDEVV
ncbi:MAG: type II toxin-antitoxin system PemK/MazF family toxin [Acidobacteriia bacterium]|nr:type II toxin-antitoxin system PemK/MazF family toxin [Terriglobia bacterium]